MVAENAAVGDSRREASVTDPDHVRRIRDSYSRWARIYDWFARATTGIGGVRQGCVSALDLDSGDTVVEFGCGPGVNLLALREQVGPSGHIVGVDVAGGMLDRARGLVARRSWENVSLVQGDATTPPVATADAVLATFVTSLFPDPYAVVSEWCDIADSVVVATFAPRGNRAANAALWGLTQVNAGLFDAAGDDALGQLDERTSASRRALADSMDAVESETSLFGTITVNAGYREA